MDVRGVLKNVKKLGISGTLKLRREREAERELAAQERRRKQAEVIEYIKLYTERPFSLSSDTDAYERAMARALELEESFSKQKGLRKKMIAGCKAHYIKELIPKAYYEKAKSPVEHKLIFMENGNCPSPSNSHLIDVLAKHYDYEIHKTGLHRRQVSELEYYENALRFAADAATAKAVFLSTANDVFSHIEMRPETKLIQLWHGVGMFKRVGWSTVGKSFGKGVVARKEYDQYRNYSYVTIAGEAQAWTFADAFHIPEDSGVIVPVGIARTDLFYRDSYIEGAYNKLYKDVPQAKGKKIILYAPTFRGAVGKAKAPDKLDIDAFGEALSDEYVLLIKHHSLSHDVPPIPDKWKDFAFDMGARKTLSIERLLAIADICISDYSSVAFEFAIMERPLIFFAYDLEDYLDKRGMYYDYDEITPGPVCKTNEEMIDYIEHIDERFDKQALLDFKHKYVGACDGHATERTIALIEK
jgi:CDP-ribitol ribitolphosphotransferase